MLFNEPKLLKLRCPTRPVGVKRRFSALQRAEIAEMLTEAALVHRQTVVSVLFNEPKLLKSVGRSSRISTRSRFSALQRAEIAEIEADVVYQRTVPGFSALQRAEIAEIGGG